MRPGGAAPVAWSPWSLLAAGLVTAALFCLGYGMGLDLARMSGWPDVPALLQHALGIALVSMACSVYYTLGPEAQEGPDRATGVRLALMLAAFLAAGTLTGVVAVRVLGPLVAA